MKEKIIYLYSQRPDFHSLYKTLISYPPKGYKIVTPGFKAEGFRKTLLKTSILKPVYRAFIKPFINLKKQDEKFLKQEIKADLIFSTGRLVLRKDVPHVIEIVDKITSLAGYDLKLFEKNKKYIEEALSSPTCKKIICWTKGCKEDFLNELDTENFKNKIEVVYLSIPPMKYKKKYKKKDKITLFFIGSINNPDDFFIKGGLETLETFKLLRKKYKNIELIVRCKLPKGIRGKYSIPGIKFIEETLPWEKIEELYKNADIFLTPSHNLNAIAPLETMSFQLPMIAIDTWSVNEIVIDGFNGFLVEKLENIPHEKEKLHLNIRSKEFLEMIKKIDKELIERIVERTELLIKNEKLRIKLGKNGKFLVEKGKFSLEERNKKLKRIFDEATKNQ